MLYDLYPAVDATFNFPPEVRAALAKSLDLRNTVVPMTQTLRNNLTVSELWDGRLILNTSTSRINRYDLATTTWFSITETLDLSSVAAGLQNNITAEAASRTSADSSLQANINNEMSNRIAIDNQLQSTITSVNTALNDSLNAEIVNRTNADSALQGNINGSNAATSAHAANVSAHGATGQVVGTTNVQTLSGKTLQTPTINGANIIGGGLNGVSFTDNGGNAKSGTDATTGRVNFLENAGAANAGGNGATPSQVDGYVFITVGGTSKKVPYYNL